MKIENHFISMKPWYWLFERSLSSHFLPTMRMRCCVVSMPLNVRYFSLMCWRALYASVESEWASGAFFGRLLWCREPTKTAPLKNRRFLTAIKDAHPWGFMVRWFPSTENFYEILWSENFEIQEVLCISNVRNGTFLSALKNSTNSWWNERLFKPQLIKNFCSWLPSRTCVLEV